MSTHVKGLERKAVILALGTHYSPRPERRGLYVDDEGYSAALNRGALIND